MTCPIALGMGEERRGEERRGEERRGEERFCHQQLDQRPSPQDAAVTSSIIDNNQDGASTASDTL
ncbi:hypothetical protein INR49_025148, partial [Caranx melampygus]